MTRAVIDRPADVRLRPMVEIMVAALRTAALEWADRNGDGGRDALTALVDESFARIPGAISLTARAEPLG